MKATCVPAGAPGLLEVKLALRVTPSGRIAKGIYHEKIGIFTDAEGGHVSFAGSANETAGGLVDNFESIKVFWSWDDIQGRVAEEIGNFEALWDNRTPGLRISDFTAAHISVPGPRRNTSFSMSTTLRPGNNDRASRNGRAAISPSPKLFASGNKMLK